MIFLFCNRHIRILYNMFKVKRNYKLHTFSVWKILRQCKRYNPGKLRDMLIVCKHLAIEAKYQTHEI